MATVTVVLLLVCHFTFIYSYSPNRQLYAGGLAKKFTITQPASVRISSGNRFGRPSKDLPQPGDCGNQIFDRIIGGTITAIDEFPWMGLLGYGRKNFDGNVFACGGALIHSKYILTAAHCATGKTERDLGGLQLVRLGEHNIEKDQDCDPTEPSDCAPPPIDVKVVKKFIHPQYKPNTKNQHHDIALLELAEDIKFTDFIKPICLFDVEPKNLFSNGKVHYISGWGLTEKNISSPIKLVTKIEITDPKTCATTYQSRFRIQLGMNQICAGGSGVYDSCQGDSGGPMMVPANIPGLGPTWFMTGIVSIGPTPCATKNVPGIYTRVSDYYDWIVNIMK